MTQDKNSKTKALLAVTFVLILAACGAGLLAYSHRYISPIPKDVEQSVNFPVYYPDQKKLPFGYTFNTKSFHNPKQNILLYAVDYSVDKKIVFSLQKKPSDNQIKKFYFSYLPLTNQINVPLGQVLVGIAGQGKNQQSIASLPTNDGVWILTTAPPDINQDQLIQVLKSLRK